MGYNDTPSGSSAANKLDDSIRQIAQNLHPQLFKVATEDGGGIDVLLHPAGMTAVSATTLIEPLLPKPRRKKGTITTHDLQGFIDATVRHTEKDKSSVFVKGDGSAIVAVLNFHGTGADQQDHGDLRVAYAPVLSRQWRAWTTIAGRALKTAEFATFLDENVEDVGQPPVKPAGRQEPEPRDARLLDLAKIHKTAYASQEELLLLARGMKVSVSAKVEENFNPQTGEIEALLSTTHKTSGSTTKVPGLFVLKIPVFDRGAVYELPCRLRYRSSVEDGLLWSFTIIKEDLAKQDAIEEIFKKVADATKLPTIYGEA